MLLVIITLVFTFAASASCQQPAEVIADVVLVRPLSLAATVIGTALFIVALPFSVPSGSVNDTARTLVAAPFNYTFSRPIGYFGYSPYYTSNVPYEYSTASYYAQPPVAANASAGAVSRPPVQGSLQTPIDKVLTYPRQGQSEQQQKIDQDACRGLAMGQTGYDPSRPPNGNPDSGNKQITRKPLQLASIHAVTR